MERKGEGRNEREGEKREGEGEEGTERGECVVWKERELQHYEACRKKFHKH